MELSQLIIDGFWSGMTGLVPLVVPVLGFMLVWKLLKDMLFD